MNHSIKKFTAGDSLLISGFMAALFPFIALTAFNHPSADDFRHANYAAQFGFWQMQADYYMTWLGRYFSMALLSINPLLGRSFLVYKLIPLILFGGLFHAFYLLLRELAGPYFDKRNILMAALALFTLYLGKMASTAQGFYWYPGAMTYQVPNIFIVYLCVCVIRLDKIQSRKQKLLPFFLSVILVFAITGSNETSMFILFLLLLSMLAWSLYRDRRVNWILFTLFVMAAIASYFVVIAPGNWVRLAIEQHHRQSFLFAVTSSVTRGLLSVFHWITFLPVTALTILFIPPAAQLAEKRTRSTSNFSVHPLFSFGVYIALLAAGFLPASWSISVPPARVINVIHLIVLLGWFFNVYVCVEYGIKKYKMTFTPLPAYAVVLMCFVAFLSFFKEGSNIRTAYKDLLSGSAAQYDKELTDRYKMFAESKDDEIEVNQLKKTPDTIFFDDITFNANDWRNTGYAKYFHKKAIVLATLGGKA